MNVLFAVFGDETRGSTRYRVFNMLPFLDDAGIDYDLISLHEPSSLTGRIFLTNPLYILSLIAFGLRLLIKAPKYDIIYLQKIPPAAPYIKLLVFVANDVIYDFDDALYTTKPWAADSTPRWKPHLDATLEAVTLVATGSPTLSEYAEQFNESVRCLPTPLPREPYLEKIKEYESDAGATNGTIVLGWIGYPENLWYLSKVESALEQVLDAYEDVYLHIITGTDRPFDPLSNRQDVRYLEWSLDKQIDFPAQADVGIRPLTDDEWTRSKNFASVNQFMALKKPVVVTPVGMLVDNVIHGVSGFHAKTDDDWVEYLSTLIEDPELRHDMGERAFEAVDENGFWLHQRAEELINVFESLGPRR